MDNLGPADVVSGLGLTKPHCHSCQPKHSKVKTHKLALIHPLNSFGLSCDAAFYSKETTKCKFLNTVRPIKVDIALCCSF